MKVNIYYGGRGMVDDPTIFVMGKIQEVLEELNVNVTRYNLYEMKNTITTLSQTVTANAGVHTAFPKSQCPMASQAAVSFCSPAA